METISSFTVNHDKLLCGMYVSRIDHGVVTYDLRFIKPNTPPYLSPDAMHTIEHLMATYLRNSEYKDNVIYFGPMGCRTGFYFLCQGLDNETALALIKSTVKKSCEHTGKIPGNSRIECGNYLAHDLNGAKKALCDYFEVIKNYSVDMLSYDYER